MSLSYLWYITNCINHSLGRLCSYLLFCRNKSLQPDSPAELGNKIYEMMAIALGGRWGRSELGEEEEPISEASSEVVSSETTQAEVVEPSEVRTENDPWQD